VAKPDKTTTDQMRQRFAERLRTARREAGLTQEALAGQAGCTQEAIVMYEGAKRLPRVEIASALGRVLNISMDDLLQ